MSDAQHRISGACHCGNLSFELRTGIRPEAVKARACDCRFCRVHGAKNWSDPDGSVVIRVREEASLQRYRFALRTADFFICKTCGAYLGAVLSDEEGSWSTVNLRLTALRPEEAVASYGAEDSAGRIERRKRVWTPTVIEVGAAD